MKLTGKAMASHSTSIAKTQETNQLAAIRLDDRKCACSCARPRSNAWSDEGSNTDSSANIRYCSEQVSIFRALGVACPKILERKIRVVWVQKEGWFWHHANAPSLFLAQIHLYYKDLRLGHKGWYPFNEQNPERKTRRWWKKRSSKFI